MDPGGLIVIVPRHLPARAATLTEALAGTNIRVVIDRRQGERRQTQQPVAVQRRQSDRRGAARVVAYVYACPVIAVGPVSPRDMPSKVSTVSPEFRPRLQDPRLQFT